MLSNSNLAEPVVNTDQTVLVRERQSLKEDKAPILPQKPPVIFSRNLP
jgi:hypothetical protein